MKKRKKRKSGKPYIFILPSDLALYLEWKSDRFMSKAEIVRRAIKQRMENDKDWTN